MKERITKTLLRSGKLLHYLIHMAIFAAFCRMFNISTKHDYSITLHMGLILFVFAVILLFTLRAYSAYNVGFVRIKMLIFSQSLATLISDGMIYVMLMIDHLELINPLPFMVLLAVQGVFNILFSWSANTVYFALNKPRRTVIIYRNKDDLNRLSELVQHPRKYQIIQLIENPADDIHELLTQMEECDAIFVAGIPATLRNGITKYCVEQDIRCYVAPHVGDIIMMGGKYMELFSVPVLRVTRSDLPIEYQLLKRTMDIVLSLMAIIVLSPIMLVTALAVRLYDGGPALYKQVRLTQNGREFQIMKFRSMRVNAEQDGVARLASENDDRITPVGKFIRACRFDELPQLFNILKGEMSIVGPRPERPEIARQYEELLPAFSLRLQVKAGLTGFAQVYGKYNTDPYDKLRMDLMYINQMSLLQDIKLMFSTVKVLFMKESTSGIASGQITAVAKAQDDVKEYIFK